MRKLVRKGRKPSGTPPGTMVYVGDRKSEPTSVRLFNYTETEVEELEPKAIEEVLRFRDKPGVAWIDVVGLGDTEAISKLGSHFGLHPIVLEDLVNTEQRPKLEEFEGYSHIVLKMLRYDQKKSEITAEQISLILGKDFVLSFQEWEGDLFNPVRERLRQGKGSVRKNGSDFLFYCLLDSIVDGYFDVLENVGEKIDDAEEHVMRRPDSTTIHSIQSLKRDVMFLRRSVWPLRDVVGKMEKTDNLLIKKSTRVYLRDVYDHMVQVIDTTESFREILSQMLDIYLSSVSNKLNEVMKVLTIIATIFIPLTFIAGVYGMNFRHMPELEIPEAYPAVWAIMASVAAVMLLYFKRRGWL